MPANTYQQRRTDGALDTGTQSRSIAFAMVIAFTGAILTSSGCSEQRANQDRPETSGSELSGAITISGSSTMAPMISDMAKDFIKLHPGVSIEMREGGSSSRGLADAREGKVDVGMVSKVIPVEEADLVPFLIARDGVAISLHSDNPVKSLSQKQLSDIYSKKIANWREVGGSDSAIYVMAATPSAGSTEIFLSYLRVKEADMRADLHESNIPARFATLAKNTGGILYSSLGGTERRVSAGETVKMLPIEGIAASNENLAAGRYSLARPLALVTKGLPSGPAKAFIDYARSPAATPLIERYEFVPYRD